MLELNLIHVGKRTSWPLELGSPISFVLLIHNGKSTIQPSTMEKASTRVLGKMKHYMIRDSKANKDKV